MQKRFYIPASSSSHMGLSGQPPRGLLASWDPEGAAGGSSCSGRSMEEDEEEEDVPASLFIQHVNLLQAEGGLGFRSEFQRIEGEEEGEEA